MSMGERGGSMAAPKGETLSPRPGLRIGLEISMSMGDKGVLDERELSGVLQRCVLGIGLG